VAAPPPPPTHPPASKTSRGGGQAAPLGLRTAVSLHSALLPLCGGCRYVVMVREEYVDEPHVFPFTLVGVDVVTLPNGVDGTVYDDPMYVAV
jgi:hypothetical protein